MTLKNSSHLPSTWRMIQSEMEMKLPASDQSLSMNFGKWDDQPHQHLPIARMLAGPWGGVLVADEVGLGKTISAIIAIRELQSRGERGGVLIVCPGGLRTKWKQELHHRVEIDAITPKSCSEFLMVLDRLEDGDEAVVIVSHGILRRAEILDSLIDRNLNLMLTIMDEAHHARNPKSRLHDGIQMLLLNSKWKMLLTATPVNLQSEDLYVLLSLIAPDRWPNITAYYNTMSPTASIHRTIDIISSDPIDLENIRLEINRLLHTTSLTDDPRLTEIRALIDDVSEESGVVRKKVINLLREMRPLNDMLVRTRRKDLDLVLAQRVPIILQVVLTEAEWNLYNAARRWSQTLQRIKNPDGKFDWASVIPERMASSCLPAYAKHVLGKIDEVREELQEQTDEHDEITRRLINRLGNKKGLIEAAENLGDKDTKLDALRAWLHDTLDYNDGGVLLFSQFHGTLNHLKHNLQNDGFIVEVLTGKTPMLERDQIRARFAQGDINILLSSEVGSEGLDQQHCHRLVNYDLPWNPMKLEQRIGRLDRYGQTSPTIQIANLCVEGTIDAAILGRLLHRIHIFESSLGMVDPMLGKAMKILAAKEIARDAIRHDLTTGYKIVDLDTYREIHDDDVEDLLNSRNGWTEEAALKERMAIGEDPGVQAVRDDVLERELGLDSAAINSILESWIIENNGELFGNSKDTVMIQMSKKMIESCIAFDKGSSKWMDLLNRMNTTSGPHWIEATYENNVARQRNEVEFLSPWHPLVHLAVSSNQKRNFAEGISGCDLIAENIRIDAIPSKAKFFIAVEWRIHGLRESRIRRWLALDKHGKPIEEIIRNPWSKSDSEPIRTLLTSDEKETIESARTQIHTALLNQERMRLLPLLTELTENSHQAWMSRIESEEEQIRKAEWNSMLKGEMVDPRWLRMKRGIIRSLHEQLSYRVTEIERIRDNMQANISFPIIVRII
ncbi:MAG: hypothetical protein CMB31_04470 [Euryarchaeota archaeon]|nr:hypothetical protein [Euryarchaeota archaeon]